MLRLLATISLLGAIATTQEQTLHLNFGVFPTDKPKVMYQKLKPVIESIRKPIAHQLGKPVSIHLRLFDDISQGRCDLEQGRVDFARVDSSGFIFANQLQHPYSLLAVELNKGLKRSNGLIVTRSDSGIKSMQEIKGNRFAFGDPLSSTGSYLPKALLLQSGVDATNLRSHDYLGRSDFVVFSVLSKNHDVGAISSEHFHKHCDPEEIKVLQVVEDVSNPWICKSALNQDIREAITSALIVIEDSEVLDSLGCSGFIEAPLDEFRFVEDAMIQSKKFTPQASSPE